MTVLDPTRVISIATAGLVGETLICSKLPLGQLRMRTLPNPCRVRFVVPVYAERVDSVRELLVSLADQDVPPGTIEAILVVNNPPFANTPQWYAARELNETMLRQPFYNDASGDASPSTEHIRSRLRVFGIDKSSRGNTVEGNNVGTARQRGLLEADLRFALDDEDGLVVHTDADCRFEDTSMVRKLLRIFDADPLLIGMGGSYTLELDLGDPEARELLPVLPRYRQWKLYDMLASDIRRGRVGHQVSSYTLGRFIVHRAFAGTLSGGVPPLSFCEDQEFVKRLRAYGTEHGLHFRSGYEPLFAPVTTLRISDRTPSSIRTTFKGLGDDETYVDDVFNPGAQIILTDAYLDRMAAAVATMPDGRARLDYLYFKHPLMNIRIKRA